MRAAAEARSDGGAFRRRGRPRGPRERLPPARVPRLPLHPSAPPSSAAAPAGEPGARVGPSPLHQPVGSTDLQMGKLRFRVYSNCSRSQRELAFEPLQCKRKIEWRVHHFAGNSGPTHLRVFNHAAPLDTYSYSCLLWVGVLLWIPALLRTSGWGRGGDSCSLHPGLGKKE